MFVSIDESGDVGRYPPSPSPFFIITAILTEDKHNLDSVISRIRRKCKKTERYCHLNSNTPIQIPLL